MSAKEIFEELGYNSRKEEYKDDVIISITYANYDKGNWVTINKSYIEYVKNRSIGYLPLNLLQAINKQIEEMGWNK